MLRNTNNNGDNDVSCSLNNNNNQLTHQTSLISPAVCTTPPL